MPETKTLSHSMVEREEAPTQEEHEEEEGSEEDGNESDSDADADDSYSDLASSNDEEDEGQEQVKSKPKQVKEKGDTKAGSKSGEIPFVFKGSVLSDCVSEHVLYDSFYIY